MANSKLTIPEKKQLLIDSITLSFKAYNNVPHNLVGKPLSYYNFNAVFTNLKFANQELIEQGYDCFFKHAYGVTLGYYNKLK